VCSTYTGDEISLVTKPLKKEDLIPEILCVQSFWLEKGQMEDEEGNGTLRWISEK
jgi:hypothetical protein